MCDAGEALEGALGADEFVVAMRAQVHGFIKRKLQRSVTEARSQVRVPCGLCVLWCACFEVCAMWSVWLLCACLVMRVCLRRVFCGVLF